MNTPQSPFTAVVLAADRGPGDPVAEAARVACKSLTPVGGIPMVLRVLDALAAAQQIDDIILCGPSQSAVCGQQDLSRLISTGKIRWVQNQATPSTSTYHVLQLLPEHTRVLVTTADHALLSARIVDFFCSEAINTGCEMVVGLASHELVAATYPGTRRTITKLRDGAYCSCNLFAFLSPRARELAHFWRRLEQQRKKPLRIIRVLGWMAILRYLSGRLTLDEAQARVSRRLGLRAGAVVLPFAEAAVDIDTVSDWKLVETIAAKQTA